MHLVTFQRESHIAYCRTLAGAQKLARFLEDRFTGSADVREHIRFRSVIETDGRVSVHASIPVNATGHDLFKTAISEFKAVYLAS